MVRKLLIISILLLLSFSSVYAVRDVGKLSKSNADADFSFLENITSDFNDTFLIDKIHLSRNRVYIDTYSYPELNHPANVTFKSCNFKNPVFTHNGVYYFLEVHKINPNKCWAILPFFSTWIITENNFVGANFTNVTLFSDGVGLSPDATLVYEFENQPFNSTVVADSSYYSLNGTIASKWVNGTIGNALSFNGINNSGTSSGLYPTATNPISIVFWMKTNVITSDAGLVCNSLTGLCCTHHTTSSTLYCYLGTGGNYLSIGGVMTNNWYHVAVTWDGTNTNNGFKLYLNGTLIQQKNSSNNISDTSVFNIGNIVTTYYNGTIDELKIYNIVLNSSQISSIYQNESSSIKYSQLHLLQSAVVWYKLDETSGTIVQDTNNNSNGSNSGAIVNIVGKKKTAYSFDGINDLISIPLTSNLRPNQKWSISVWENGSVLNDTNEDYYVQQDDGSIYAISTYLGRLYCYSSNQVGLGVGGFSYLIDNTSNKWHHFVCVTDYSTGLQHYYQNNIYLGNTSIVGTGFNQSSNKNITLSTISFPLNSTLDEVTFYNFSLSAQNVSDIYLFTGLQLDYGLNELSSDSIADSSGNNYTGTLSNYFRPENVTGKYGTAFSFDGVDDYMTIPASQRNALLYNSTLAIWFKGQIQDSRLFTKTGLDYYLAISSGLKLYCYAGVSPFPTTSYNLNSSQWYQAICTYDGTNLSLYVDGILADSDNCSNCQSKTNTTAGFTFASGGTNFYNGTIDEFKVFNRTFDSAEVTEFYTSNLLGKWYSGGQLISKIYNGSDFNQTLNNKILNVTYNGSLQNVTVYGKFTTNCSNITSESWVLGSKTGNYILFNQNLLDKCFQLRHDFQGDTNTTYYIINYTIYLDNDTIAPTISIHNINNRTQFTNNRILSINITANDINLSFWNVSVYNSSHSLINSNQTIFDIYGQVVRLNVTIDGNYTINLSATDVSNNSNSTLTYIYVDTVPPTFSFIPNNFTLVWGSNLAVNFSATDGVSFANYSINDTGFVVNSTGWLRNSGSPTVLTHDVNVTINDSASNLNWTTFRLIVTPIVTVSGRSGGGANYLRCAEGQVMINYSCYNITKASNITISNITAIPNVSSLNLLNASKNVADTILDKVGLEDNKYKYMILAFSSYLFFFVIVGSWYFFKEDEVIK